MSKISTYSLADEPLQLSDRLIGTEAPRPIPSATPLATKNFSLGELLQLFSSEFPAASLQAVLDTGNTATQDITLTGTITTSVIKPDEIEDVLGSQGTTFQFLSKAANGINWVDLPQNYPTLDDVLDAGNTSSLSAKVGGISLYNSSSSTGNGYVSLSGFRNFFTAFNNTNKPLITALLNGIILYDVLTNNSFNIRIPTPLSNNHSAFFQNTSGTLAYLQDIPDEIELTTIGSTGPATLIGSTLNIPNYSGDVAIPTLDEVLDSGNTSELDANIGQLGLYDPASDAYAEINSNNNLFLFKNSIGNIVFTIEQALFTVHKTNAISAIISSNTLTSTRNFELPNASGTIALTSDISVPTLDEVLDEGNISELNANIGELGLYDSLNSQYYKIVANDELFKFKNNLGSNIFIVGYSEFSLFNGTGTIAANFSSALLTITRNFQFPNASGTIALTSDIPSLLGYVPYIGAVSSVNLGEYELKAGQLSLDTSPTGTLSVGTTQWNDTIGSSQTLLKGGTVILKNGVDLVARVVNKVTPNATLLRANYQAVRISGAQGQRLAVAYAQANNDNNSADTIGLVCENISTNQEGFIITIGQLEEINTTGSLQGETWSDGDVLYLSPTTAGKLTNIKPNGATGHIVVMGYVEYSHAIHGKIYVKIMNGWELDELHNVYINSPANNNVLAYTSSTQLWENKTIDTVLGFTPENVANKSTNLFLDQASNVKYPSAKAVADYALYNKFPQFSFKANNTSTNPDVAQDIYFQQTGKQPYTGSVTWSGTTSPSGTTNFTFNWIRIGNMVTLNITLHYSVPGTANTGAVVPLLSSMPTPVSPDGLSASLRYIYPAYGKMSLNDTSVTTAASEVAMRINAASNGYEFVISQSSTSAKVLKITCQYFTA